MLTGNDKGFNCKKISEIMYLQNSIEARLELWPKETYHCDLFFFCGLLSWGVSEDRLLKMWKDHDSD